MVCPFVGIHRGSRWVGHLTRGPARGLSIYCTPGTSGSPRMTKGLSFCRDSSFSSRIQSSRERSGHLPGSIVSIVGQSLSQEVWPFVVGRAGEGLGRKGLSFCRDQSFLPLVWSSYQRSRKRSVRLSGSHSLNGVDRAGLEKGRRLDFLHHRTASVRKQSDHHPSLGLENTLPSGQHRPPRSRKGLAGNSRELTFKQLDLVVGHDLAGTLCHAAVQPSLSGDGPPENPVQGP